jgi:outer membrane lipoprotein-sorting protein
MGRSLCGVKYLRRISTRRLIALCAATVAVGAGATAFAVAATGGGPKPPAEPLPVAVHDALTAPTVQGVTARIHFTNDLIAGSSVQGADPLLTGASGRLWATSDGQLRLELQADSNAEGATSDSQVLSDGHRWFVYDSGSNTVFKGTLPADHGGADGVSSAKEQPPSLDQVKKGIAKLAEHAAVGGAEPTDIAGQPAYTVRVEPKSNGGLLGGAELAWDATHGTPLRAAVYAKGDSSPVLELEATRISYGKVDSSVFDVKPPANAKVTDFTPKGPAGPGGAEAKPVTGAAAVAKAVPFTLAAPDKLVGLPRHEVRLVHAGDHPAALVTYGAGLGGIAVLEQAADPSATANGTPKEGESGLSLPKVSINGATGQELDTALGTMVRFTRAGVTYTVIGSVPAAAAEAAARGL